MKNKWINYGVFLILFTIVIGCQSDSATNSKDLEPVTIEFWNLAVDGDELVNAAMEEAVRLIEEEKPHITIDYITMDGDEYKTRIKTAIVDDRAPDLFYTWLPGYAQNFVDSGYVLKLDEYLSEDTYNNINMNVLESGNASYDGIYALSSEVKMGVLYCNNQLFDQYNIKIPDTYDELMTAVEQFNKEGIQPMLTPGKRVWPVMWLYDIMAIKSIGSSEVVSALKKNTTFDQEEFLSAAEKMTALVNEKAFLDNSVGLDNIQANEMFLNGESPMYYMGSWFAANTTDPSKAIYNNVTVKRFPGFDNEFDRHMLGGVGDGFMVSNSSQYKEEAVWVMERFTRYMSESDVVFLPTWNVDKDYSEMDSVFIQIVDLFEEADSFVIWWDTYMESVDAQTHKGLTLKLFTGAITPKEFIQDMKSISESN